MKDENFIRKADYAMLEQRYGLAKYYPSYVHNPSISTPVLRDLIIDKPLYADANRRKKKRQELARERQMMDKLESVKIEERQRDRDRQRAQQQQQDHCSGLEFRNPFGDGKFQVVQDDHDGPGSASSSQQRSSSVFSKRHHSIASRFISFVRGPSDGDEVTPPSSSGSPSGLEPEPSRPLLGRAKSFDQTKSAQTSSRMKGVFKKKHTKVVVMVMLASCGFLWRYRG